GFLDQGFEASEHPALGHVDGGDRQSERLADFLGILAVDRGLPERLPGRLVDSRPQLLGGPVKESALAVVVPLRFVVTSRELLQSLEGGRPAGGSRRLVGSEPFQTMAYRREQPAAKRAFARVIGEVAQGPCDGRQDVLSQV